MHALCCPTWQSCCQQADLLGDAVAARHTAGVNQLVLDLTGGTAAAAAALEVICSTAECCTLLMNHCHEYKLHN
jgi:hypothetical protein